MVKGDQRGRTLGFPTANLAIAERRLIPADGIYAARVKIGERWYGSAVNIGIRPMFDSGERLVEVFVLDFDGDLYDQVIQVQFIRRLRAAVNGLETLREMKRMEVCSLQEYHRHSPHLHLPVVQVTRAGA